MTKGTEKAKPPITKGFGNVFRNIRRRERFESPSQADLQERIEDALIAASLAKCVEFNIVVNRSHRYDDEAYLLVSGLRSIIEDLIVLVYLKKHDAASRREFYWLRIRLDLAEALEAQEAFFDNNNPVQPVLRATVPEGGEKRSVLVRRQIKEFWKARGINRAGGPTVHDMANEIGLGSTYDYIYFLTSNFSHFNPHAMLRTGWGSTLDYTCFSLRHINGYYQSVASFYGSVIFLGLYSAFPSHFKIPCDREVKRLLALINMMHRWPELVTFEEMNKKAPLYLLTHAMREVMKEDDPTPYGAILTEVGGLGAWIAANGASPEA